MVSLTSIPVEKPAWLEVLCEKHRRTLSNLSALSIWRRELDFFKKIVEQFSQKIRSGEGKQKIDHFRHLISHYSEDAIPQLNKKLLGHERNLSDSIEDKELFDPAYLKEHDELMLEFDNLANKIFLNLLRHIVIR